MKSAYQSGVAAARNDRENDWCSGNPYYDIEGAEEDKRAWDEGYSAAFGVPMLDAGSAQ